MISSEVQRTLVKSPPELWAELSDPTALAGHLGELGDVRVTRVEPEKTVEWEAADTTGKVTLAASGWGTKVTLAVTREIPTPEPPAEPEPAIVAEPAAEPEAITEEPGSVMEPEPESPIADEPGPRPRFFARIFRRRRKEQALPQPAVEPAQPEAIEIVEPEPTAGDDTPPEDTPPEDTRDIAAELAAAEEVAAEQVTAVLTAVLDRLGAAHHRPFSRA